MSNLTAPNTTQQVETQSALDFLQKYIVDTLTVWKSAYPDHIPKIEKLAEQPIDELIYEISTNKNLVEWAFNEFFLSKWVFDSPPIKQVGDFMESSLHKYIYEVGDFYVCETISDFDKPAVYSYAQKSTEWVVKDRWLESGDINVPYQEAQPVYPFKPMISKDWGSDKSYEEICEQGLFTFRFLDGGKDDRRPKIVTNVVHMPGESRISYVLLEALNDGIAVNGYGSMPMGWLDRKMVISSNHNEVVCEYLRFLGMENNILTSNQ